MRGQRINYRLQFSIHRFRKLMNCQPNAVIGDAVLGKVVRAYLLAAVPTADHGLALFSQCFLLLLHLDFVEPGAQHAHALLAVLDLRFLVLATHDRVCWNVGDADGRISRVHRLPARTR